MAGVVSIDTLIPTLGTAPDNRYDFSIAIKEKIRTEKAQENNILTSNRLIEIRKPEIINMIMCQAYTGDANRGFIQSGGNQVPQTYRAVDNVNRNYIISDINENVETNIRGEIIHRKPKIVFTVDNDFNEVKDVTHAPQLTYLGAGGRTLVLSITNLREHVSSPFLAPNGKYVMRINRVYDEDNILTVDKYMLDKTNFYENVPLIFYMGNIQLLDGFGNPIQGKYKYVITQIYQPLNNLTTPTMVFIFMIKFMILLQEMYNRNIFWGDLKYDNVGFYINNDYNADNLINVQFLLKYMKICFIDYDNGTIKYDSDENINSYTFGTYIHPYPAYLMATNARFHQVEAFNKGLSKDECFNIANKNFKLNNNTKYKNIRHKFVCVSVFQILFILLCLKNNDTLQNRAILTLFSNNFYYENILANNAGANATKLYINISKRTKNILEEMLNNYIINNFHPQLQYILFNQMCINLFTRDTLISILTFMISQIFIDINDVLEPIDLLNCIMQNLINQGIKFPTNTLDYNNPTNYAIIHDNNNKIMDFISNKINLKLHVNNSGLYPDEELYRDLSVYNDKLSIVKNKIFKINPAGGLYLDNSKNLIQGLNINDYINEPIDIINNPRINWFDNMSDISIIRGLKTNNVAHKLYEPLHYDADLETIGFINPTKLDNYYHKYLKYKNKYLELKKKF